MNNEERRDAAPSLSIRFAPHRRANIRWSLGHAASTWMALLLLLLLLQSSRANVKLEQQQLVTFNGKF